MLFRIRATKESASVVAIPITLTRQNHSLAIPYTPNPNNSTIISSLFHQLNSPPNLLEARRLHALLLLLGFFHPTCPHKFLTSQLVNVYVNLGSFRYAFLSFTQLPPNHNSNVAWNAILRALVGSRNFNKVIQFYHSMLRHGVIPDNYTYPLVFKACSSLHALQYGKWVHRSILNNKAKPNLYVQSAVIDMFVKCGSLEDARKVFEEMYVKDLASWTAIICGTLWNGEWFEAFSLFRNMRSQGLMPDSVIVASILPVCAKLETLKLGMALQGCAVRSGFENDLYVSNAIIDMYCKSGHPLQAHRVFTYMVCKDTVSWCTLIAGYSQNGLYLESCEIYVRMVKMGFATNGIVATSVMSALGKLKLLKHGKEMHNFVLKQGLLLDVVLAASLIDMYANCGSIREAELIFNYMSDKNISVWNSLIVGYKQVGDFQSAFLNFRKIWVAENRPNFITLVSVLPICTQLGALRQGKEIHGYATKSGLGIGLDTSVGNCLIDMYSKCGFLELGVRIFNQMMVKNIITYNTMISACGGHGLGEKGLAFYDQMKEAGIKPNKVTFISLLSACSHAGLIDRGWLLYNSMIDDHGIVPDMEHYSCMVDLIGRAGDLDGAYKFITKMPVTPDANVWGSLLGACRLHNKMELAELLFSEHLFQINPEDPGHYVLLSNLYASGKRWEDMSKMRSLIKDKGLEKKPGSSWIQMGEHIYVFHATGTSHPAFAKIEDTLDSLLSVMKSEDQMLAILGFCSHANDQFLT